MELVFSIVAIVLSLIAIVNERMSLHDEAYDKFSQFWFGIDDLFIEHPEMRKYFYRDKKGNYAPICESDDSFELAVCIAERICDVFQYTKQLEKYLESRDFIEYKKYKEMIMCSPIFEKADLIDPKTGEFLWAASDPQK